MKQLTYKCDVCGKTKEDVNHWFIVLPVVSLTRDTQPSQQILYNGVRLEGVIVVKWQDAHADISDGKHACGQDHAFALVGRWMHHNSFELPTGANS